MKKEYSVFITVEGEELADILHKHFRKTGLLADIPIDAERELFEGEVSLEYKWESDHE